jgi:hypothetical protein
MTDAAKEACVSGVSGSCDTTTNGTNFCGPDSDIYFASLASISIPAGGKVLVYVGSYDGSTTGKVVLNIRTDTLK